MALNPAEEEGALTGHKNLYLEDKCALVHPAC